MHARTRFLALFLATLLLAASAFRADAAPAPGTAPQIRVLSNRADLVSGGDALVEIVVPAGAGAPTVDANGRNVTSAFRRLGNGRVLGLVTGLRVGSNTLTARAGGRAARLTVKNAPIGGPVFSGPQIQPWTCQAGAVDAKCNQATTYQLLYLPTAGAQLQPYDPANPPPASSIAQTTTQTGKTVPFIVREETGYIARDEYRIAVLFQPGKPWSASAPQPQFNHKLVITHGASCDTSYETGSAPDVRNRTALGAGFVVMSHALNNAGHNCNLTTQAEAMVMTKERVIERYGELRYTIGSGCSGGSLVQQQVANAYPGLYQGISPQCSFTDAWSSAMQYVDYVGLLALLPGPDAVGAGHACGTRSRSPRSSTTRTRPTRSRSRPRSPTPAIRAAPAPACPTRTSTTRRRTLTASSARCRTTWSTCSASGPDGFANRPIGNTGIQYGLEGLQSGLVSPQQFVDLNTKIGGLGYDGNPTPNRVAPDHVGLSAPTAPARSTRRTTSTRSRSSTCAVPTPVPSTTCTAPTRCVSGCCGTSAPPPTRCCGAVRSRSSVTRPSPIRRSSPSTGGCPGSKPVGRSVGLARKIIENRPASVTERCTDGLGHAVPRAVCDQTVAAYGTPRMAAGGPLADDTLQCQLKPLARADYDVTFTNAQWARLRATFPNGVCDYTRPGVAQRGAISWLTYQDAAGRVVYGGRPLGPPPVSTVIS